MSPREVSALCASKAIFADKVSFYSPREELPTVSVFFGIRNLKRLMFTGLHIFFWNSAVLRRLQTYPGASCTFSLQVSWEETDFAAAIVLRLITSCDSQVYQQLTRRTLSARMAPFQTHSLSNCPRSNLLRPVGAPSGLWIRPLSRSRRLLQLPRSPLNLVQ